MPRYYITLFCAYSSQQDLSLSLLYVLVQMWYMFQLNNDPRKLQPSESSNRKKLLNTKVMWSCFFLTSQQHMDNDLTNLANAARFL